jgi:hypothetical protein
MGLIVLDPNCIHEKGNRCQQGPPVLRSNTRMQLPRIGVMFPKLSRGDTCK